jgi:hypothetical protein
MSAAISTAGDLDFEDDYQRARRMRMRAAGLAGNPEPTKVGRAPVHSSHEGTEVLPKDAQAENPEPRAVEERPLATHNRASDLTPSESPRSGGRAEVRSRQKLSRLERAVALLKQELAAGPASARVIYERGARAGLSERTIDRAKREAQVESKRIKTDRGMRWFWCLPSMEPGSLDQCVS